MVLQQPLGTGSVVVAYVVVAEWVVAVHSVVGLMGWCVTAWVSWWVGWLAGFVCLWVGGFVGSWVGGFVGGLVGLWGFGQRKARAWQGMALHKRAEAGQTKARQGTSWGKGKGTRGRCKHYPLPTTCQYLILCHCLRPTPFAICYLPTYLQT